MGSHTEYLAQSIPMPDNNFHPVTRDRFFTVIKDLSDRNIDVHPSLRLTPYPFTSDWKKRNGEIIGISEDYLPGTALHETRYFLKNP